MTAVLLQHVPHAQASILAGALRSAGFHADVWGEQAAHLYGEMALGGCSLVVQDYEFEEAEAYLASSPEDAPPESTEAPETSPTDGEPPGIATLLYCGLWLALGVALVLTLIAGGFLLVDVIWGSGGLMNLLKILPWIFWANFVTHIQNFAFIAIGAGILLPIIQGYRAGSKTCRLVVWLVAAIMIPAPLFCCVGG